VAKEVHAGAELLTRVEFNWQCTPSDMILENVGNFPSRIIGIMISNVAPSSPKIKTRCR
jgi:hypothetical protein